MKVLVEDFLEAPSVVLLNNHAEFIKVIDDNLVEINERRIDDETDDAMLERLVCINGDVPMTYPCIATFYWSSSSHIVTVNCITQAMVKELIC